MVIGDAKHIQQEMGQASRQGARCGGTELNQDVLGTQEVFSVLYPENCWLYICCISIPCVLLPPLTCSFRVYSGCIQVSALGATAERGKIGLGSLQEALSLLGRHR